MARGLRAKHADDEADANHQPQHDDPDQPIIADPVRLDRRRWAMLIKRIYQADPLRCPKCGGTMKIIAFIEADQGDIIGKILEHCGLWEDPPSRGPPGPGCGPRPVRSMPDAEDGIRYEIDPDFLEYARRAAACAGVSGRIPAGEQAELPWEA